jgi:hypothetical protein
MAIITISVQSLLNAALYDNYTVNDGITVGTLKTTMQSATGVDVSWFVLAFAGEELSNGSTLVSYSIVNGSQLQIGNVIGTLTTLQDRQLAKLDLAALNRTAEGNPRDVYDITELPSQYIGNVSTPNPHPGGLIEGRPWTP